MVKFEKQLIPFENVLSKSAMLNIRDANIEN